MSRSPDEFVILHVDDDSQLLALSETFLTQEDDRLVVETTTDPTAAAEMISARAYDAVISDYQMPEMTGLELLEHVRKELNSQLPFIIFTGEGREAVASEALNLGANRYLQKGGDPKTQYTMLADAVVQEVEHANAKTSLQENREKYAGVYENAPLAFVIWNQDRTVVDWNGQAEELFGWQGTDAHGSQLDELLIPPDQRERLEAVSEPLLRHGEPTQQVIENVTKNGTRVICHWYNTPLQNSDSNVTEVMSMILDITKSRERKAKLQEYATAVEASDDSIYMLDPDGTYVFANNEHLTRLKADGKIPQADETAVAGRPYAEIHAAPAVDRIQTTLDEVCASGEPKTEEYEFETETRWSYRTYSPVSDPETGQRVGVVVISKDITQRKQIKERQDFLYSLLRHDVKNKIHTAQGYQQLVSDSDCSPEAVDHLTTATKALSDGLDIIEKISMLSQVTQEELEPVDIRRVLSTVVDTHRSQARSNGIELSRDLCGGSVRGGPLLEALFGNLVDNAVTHSNADTIEVTCRSEGDEYVIIVADDGNGLPHESTTALFERGVSKGKTAGSGLGLYLVSEIVDSYGGSISLSESASGGLCVTVRLIAA
jgi:PAS domain S-box-containing protein